MRDVLSGEVSACQYVKWACQRQVDDLKRQSTAWPYRFSIHEAHKWCHFIEGLPHIKGPKAGTLIHLEPWECFIVTTVFGWVHKTLNKRRFRRSYIEVPRGNAKSTLSSGVALCALGADNEGGAEVYSAATTRDQAKIVWDVAHAMVRRTPGLKRHFGIEAMAHSIFVMDTASKFVPLSSDAGNLDGLNTHVAIVDELHAHKTREVHDVLETSLGKRDRSMLWEITTAGSDRSGICYEVRTYCLAVLDPTKETTDDGQFAVIYTIDEGDDWTDPATWRKANPNWGVSVMPEVIEGLARKAMELPSAQANFMTKHLDVWINSASPWMPMDKWDRCADHDIDWTTFTKDDCFGGLDLASKIDIAADVKVFRRTIDNKIHYYVKTRFTLPESTVQESRNSQYDGWVRGGYMRACPGDVTDFGWVEQDQIDDHEQFNLVELGYDPWQSAHMAQRLIAAGVNCVEVRPSFGNFSEPMKEVEALVREGRIHHDGNPVMAWMISNVVCHYDNKDNVYPRKETPYNKIDGVVAMLMALSRALVTPPKKTSVYERRGLISVGDEPDDAT